MGIIHKWEDPGTVPPRVSTYKTEHSQPPLKMSSSNRLTLEDMREVRRLLFPIRRMWYSIGIELGLSVGDLDTIRADQTDVLDCLTAMLKKWLSSHTTPMPSWRALGDALRAPTINAVELANKGKLTVRT